MTRWFLFQNRLVGLARRYEFTPPEAGLSLEFQIPMPPSWPKKKRAAMLGQPHQQSPDWDNLAKAFFDALMGEDCRIWNVAGVSKVWAEQGAIVVTMPAAPAQREPERGEAA